LRGSGRHYSMDALYTERYLDKTLMKLFWIIFLSTCAHAQILTQVMQSGVPLVDGGTWSFVQVKGYDYGAHSIGTVTGSGCDSSVSTCKVCLSNTAIGSCDSSGTGTLTPGNLVVVVEEWLNAGATLTMSSPTATGQTFTHCGNCAGGDTTAGFVDAWWTVAASGTPRSLTCTLSGAPASWNACIIYEFHTTGTSITKDPNASSSGFTASVAVSGGHCAGKTLTLTGTDDVLVQFAIPSNSITAVSAGWTTDATPVDGMGYAYKLNTNSGTAPSWTDTSGTCTVAGIAFRSQQ
jgi:hypothetical protein